MQNLHLILMRKQSKKINYIPRKFNDIQANVTSFMHNVSRSRVGCKVMVNARAFTWKLGS